MFIEKLDLLENSTWQRTDGCLWIITNKKQSLDLTLFRELNAANNMRVWKQLLP